jgi:hypothetical protein
MVCLSDQTRFSAFALSISPPPHLLIRNDLVKGAVRDPTQFLIDKTGPIESTKGMTSDASILESIEAEADQHNAQQQLGINRDRPVSW